MAGLALAIGSAGAASCGGKNAPGAVDYSVSAPTNYDRGMAELASKDWTAAAKYFSFIKSRFPYSRYAVLAELRLADAEFGADEHLNAIDDYRAFATLHPTHEMVVNGYTSLRVAEAYVAELPGDLWILPPSYEKDQSATEEAEAELRHFLEKFPDSPYRKRGEELLVKVGRRLADHEWYVARYYWDRGKPMGTVLRLRRMLERYPGTGHDVDGMWLLGKAYLKVGMPDRARQTWSELATKFPDSGRAKDARSAIAKLPATAAPASGPPLPQ
ncbi:MAG TPA: outer membrane protein assembly factor BamD [Kofleriaceae bacterium]|nr:outer membrane protein assembly factor BamD [Kofleriaceae bacterium]